MKPKTKLKPNEPSARDKLSASFLKAFESDFETHGVEVIEQLREKHPDRYAQIATQLIAAVEPKSDGFESCQGKEAIGRRLLRSRPRRRRGGNAGYGPGRTRCAG